MPRGTQGHRQESDLFRLRGYHPLCLAFPDPSAKDRICNSLGPCRDPVEPYNPHLQRLPPITQTGLGSSPFARHYSGNDLFSSEVLRCFSSLRAPRLAYSIQPAVPGHYPGGFPHSGIPGSTLDDSSPRLIAAIHVLLRLLAPRHPPYALSSLIHVRRQSLDTSCIRLLILFSC